MAEQEQLDIVISLRDEASETAKKVRAAMGSLRQEAKADTIARTQRLKNLENVAYYTSRELGSVARNIGVTGAFVSGGVVASLTAIGASMGNFARQSLQLRDSAKDIGLTVEQFQKFQYAMQAQGATADKAAASIQNLGRAVLDLRRGLQSETRQKFSEQFKGFSGTEFADQLLATYNKDGMDAAQKLVMRTMESESKKNTENSRWNVQVLQNILGMDPSSAEAYSMIDRFKGAVQPSQEAAQRYLVEQIKLEVSLTNLTSRIAIAVMPLLTKLVENLAKFVTEENLKALADQLKAFADRLLEADWETIRQNIDRALTGIGRELGAFARDTLAIVQTLNQVVQTINSWKQNNNFEQAKPIPYLNNPMGGESQAQHFGDVDWNAPQGRLYTLEEDQEDYEKRRFHPDINFIPGAPESENIEDRREFDPTMQGDRGEPGWMNQGYGGPGSGRDRQRFSGGDSPFGGKSGGRIGNVDRKLQKQTLLETTRQLKTEFQRLADGLRDKRGGAGGGNVEGGVTEAGRNRPMKTGAGGRGGAVPPVFPGRPEEGRHVVKGSWFGQFKDTAGSILPKGWIDPDDVHKSGPKKGQTLGNYGGYDQETPGVAIPYYGSAGKPGQKQGAPVRVWDLNRVGPGVRSHLVRQVDIGPNQAKAPSNEKGIDVNSPLAERMGYAPDKAQGTATGRPVFPTGGKFGYEVVNQSNMLRTLRDMEVERKRFSGEPIPWSRHRGDVDNALNGFNNGPRGKLELDVNVKGPRGVKADAEVSEGDFIPADKGVRVNHEMSLDE